MKHPVLKKDRVAGLGQTYPADQSPLTDGSGGQNTAVIALLHASSQMHFPSQPLRSSIQVWFRLTIAGESPQIAEE